MDHLEETKNHVTRLEKNFLQFDVSPFGNPSETMHGLLAQAQDKIDVDGQADKKTSRCLTGGRAKV